MGTFVGSLASALHVGGGVNPLCLCSGYQSVWAWENEGELSPGTRDAQALGCIITPSGLLGRDRLPG